MAGCYGKEREKKKGKNKKYESYVSKPYNSSHDEHLQGIRGALFQHMAPTTDNIDSSRVIVWEGLNSM